MFESKKAIYLYFGFSLLIGAGVFSGFQHLEAMEESAVIINQNLDKKWYCWGCIQETMKRNDSTLSYTQLGLCNYEEEAVREEHYKQVPKHRKGKNGPTCCSNQFRDIHAVIEHVKRKHIQENNE